MSENQRAIYPLRETEELTPEVIAVAFAKCSRSPESFAEIAKGITAEKSAEFHAKWVVGYGHSSVAEHATIHVAFENVSTVAAKVIEDCRLASYTEKSTRYQIYDHGRYYKPEKILSSRFADAYVKTLNELFDAYAASIPPLMELMRRKHPKPEEMKEKLYEGVTKARACDVARYYLPAATLTNLGMTANARIFEWAITKFMSHPLDEMREIGAELKKTCLEVTPTLVKYADYNEYLASSDRSNPGTIEPSEPVRIVEYDRDAEAKLATALLYRSSHLPYEQIRRSVAAMTENDRRTIINDALKNRGPHDPPPRELEHIYFTFDILMDYGAFRDVQRHRMATQTNQLITAAHGFDVPPEIVEAGLEASFRAQMDATAALYHELEPEFPHEAQYVVPMAYRKRVLITWNLRELHHFIALRSGKKGHPSYRRIAQLCWTKLNEIYPWLTAFIRVDMTDETLSTVGNKPQAIGSL